MIVSKEFRFSASHILPRHPGLCANLHGHNWILVPEIHGDIDPGTGFVMDYHDLGRIVDPLIKRVDHKHLNCFCTYPSSENLLIWFAHELIARMPVEFSLIRSRLVLKLSETDKTWAVWDSSVASDLAHFQDPTTAEWRAPDPGIPGGTDPAELIRKVKGMLPGAAERYFGLLTTLEQAQLYVDTVDWKPDLSEVMEQGKFDDGKTR